MRRRSLFDPVRDRFDRWFDIDEWPDRAVNHVATLVRDLGQHELAAAAAAFSDGRNVLKIWGGWPARGAATGYVNGEWRRMTPERLRSIWSEVVAPTRFDPARPGDMSLRDITRAGPEDHPAALWAIVAMRNAYSAARAIARLADDVEDAALDLLAPGAVDRSLWDLREEDEVRWEVALLRAAGAVVAQEDVDYVRTSVAGAREALALARSACAEALVAAASRAEFQLRDALEGVAAQAVAAQAIAARKSKGQVVATQMNKGRAEVMFLKVILPVFEAEVRHKFPKRKWASTLGQLVTSRANPNLQVIIDALKEALDKEDAEAGERDRLAAAGARSKSGKPKSLFVRAFSEKDRQVVVFWYGRVLRAASSGSGINIPVDVQSELKRLWEERLGNERRTLSAKRARYYIKIILSQEASGGITTNSKKEMS